MDDIFDTIVLDTDADGAADTFVTQGTVDNGSDDFGDVTVYRVDGFTDADGDFVFDTFTIVEDSDFDGTLDTVSTFTDTDTDGIFDTVSILDITDDDFSPVVIDLDEYAKPGGVEPGSYYDNYENFDPDDFDHGQVTGDPGDSLRYWELQEGNSCALHTQRAMIEELTGLDLEIEQLEEIGIDQGVYDPNGGTNIEDLSYMLDHYNVDNSGVMQNGTLGDLRECLNRGGKILVGIDANHIWNESFLLPSGHAVEVIGYDSGENALSAADDKIIINDSGHPDGEGAMVPVDDFMRAWNWSGNVYVEAYGN
jgi:hypothetical protein